MAPEIKESAFEDAIVNVLVTGRMSSGPDSEAKEPSPGFGEFIPGGYQQRTSAEHDRDLCLIPEWASGKSWNLADLKQSARVP